MLDYPDSYYTATRCISLANVQPLKGEQTADVVVVGGGISGCSAALHLAGRGYRVVLLEAGRVGWGASGRAGGQLLNGYGSGLGPYVRQLGQRGARQVWNMSREAVQLASDLIEQQAIACDLRWGSLAAAVKPRHLRFMQQRIQLLRDVYGYDRLQWLERDALRERVVCDHYLGGIRDPEGGHLHPLNYTLGLARAAQLAGASLHEQSAVIGLDRGPKVKVRTRTGSVSADFVVLAGNAYMADGLVPELRGRMMPIGNYIAATQPLSDEQLAHTLPQNDAVYDENFVLDYYHLSADRRMLYGGFVSYGKTPPRHLRTRMAARLQKLFPALSGVRMDYQWEGTVGITRNRAPHLGRLGSNIYYMQGYSGHGIALATLSGKLVAEALGGQAERFDRLASLEHRRFPGLGTLRTPLLVLATTFYRIRDLL